ncbi:MAG TPA: type VI secretion system baseplate subunit TssK [Casimicrobiaceae bacterium]|jgi:type VI secretion system protein ImpJ|nr:type VI secretion system baseplate subunit TssK [Casimicrobiaceae bacterium]
MAWSSKVVWSEGMFLRPQHFQQQERFFEFYAHSRALPMEAFFWGFRELRLDDDALALGRVAIASAQGILPDGTPFHVPAHGGAPEPLEIAATDKDQLVYLSIPLARQQAEAVTFADDARSLARFRVIESEVPDVNSTGGEPAIVQLGEMRLRLVRQSDMTDASIGVKCARIVERRPDNQVVLDRAFIPPILASGLHGVLGNFTRELLGLLHQRGEALAARLAHPGKGGISEVGDFLMLELVNRWEPVVRHWTSVQTLHPERLFAGLLQLAGDLCTHTKPNRRPGDYPDYDHDNLTQCFAPLMADLRTSLSMVLEQGVIPIELQDRSHGVRVAIMPSPDLVRSASFVLAVSAAVPPEVVRTRFPAQVKIGPVEKLRDLVNLHLPGVGLRPLPVAPRQLPYNAGYNYFELDTTHELWKQLDRSGGMGMHIAGEFPELALEFWAIRR